MWPLTVKKRGSKLNIKNVEEFIGLCEDIGADGSIIVSSVGFTEGARRTARSGVRPTDRLHARYFRRHVFRGRIALAALLPDGCQTASRREGGCGSTLFCLRGSHLF